MNISNLLLRITGDNKDAKASLAEVSARLKAFAAEDAEARIKLAGAADVKRQLGELERSLTVIGSRNVTAHVKVKIDDSRAKLAALRHELEHALGGGVGARSISTIARDIEQLGGTIATMGVEAGSFFAQMAAGAGQLALKIGGALVSAFIGVISQIAMMVIAIIILLPLVVALAGVVATLIAGLLAAAAGLAALAVAFLGVLAPAIAVLVAIVMRLVGAYKALKDSQDKAKENSQALADAEKTHADAVEAAAAAEQRVAATRLEAYRAQRDAALAVKDAELALADARLGIVDADIRLERAKLNLKDLRGEAEAAGPAFERLFDKAGDVEQLGPSQLASLERKIGGLPGKSTTQLDLKTALQEVAHARLGVQQAALSEETATNRLADANQRNNEFLQQGITAYEPYTQAIETAADANERAAETQKDVTKLRKEQRAELDKYSKAELSVAGALIKLFEKIKDVFATAAKPALDGLLFLIDSVIKLLNDEGIQGGLDKIGEAFGFVFRQLGKMLRTREVRHIFRDLANFAARFVRVIGGKAFPDFLLIMLRIARAAAPALLSLFRGFARFLSGLSDGDKKGEKLEDTIHKVVRTFRRWWNIAKDVARVIINFVKAALPEADKLAKKIRKWVDHFADLLGQKEGRDAIKQWIEDSIEKVITLIDTFQGLLDKINAILGPISKLAGWIEKSASFLGESAGKVVFSSGGDLIEDKAGMNKFRDAIKVYEARGDYEAAERLRATALVAYPGMKFARGGIATSMTRGWFGEAGPEAVIPLRREVLAGIGAGIVEASSQTAGPSSRSVARGLGGGGDFHQNNHITLPPPPAAEIPDARAAAVMLARELERRGGGSLKR